MNWTEIEPKAVQLCNEIKTSMDTMSARQVEWNLPETGSEFKKAREGLDKTEFNVVVCGEVKRGKSTLINAILGRELLPTGVQETTCQVFRISNGPESFKLVFDDGKEEPIAAEDLIKYGSQVAADQAAMPLLAGRSLKWIDVRVPAKFLPKGVHLVDTPGLGALYAAHSIITNKYVTQADAVVFILDTGRPLVVDELDFLRRVFEITPNVIFVQGKIDAFGETWEETLQRNKKLLNENFKRGNQEIEIFPISSLNLFDASQETNPQNQKELLQVSRFENFRSQLELAMYRIVGWFRSAAGLTQACRYHGTIRNWFEEQKKNLSSTPKDKQENFAQKEIAKTKFENEWKTGGNLRESLLAEVQTILRCVKGEASRIADRNTGIHSKISKQIDALSSSEIESYAKKLGDKINDAVTKEWRGIMEGVMRQIEEKANSYSISYDGELVPVAIGDTEVRGLSLSETVTSVARGKMLGGAAVGLGLWLTTIVAPVIIPFIPVIVAFGICAGIWDALTGAKKRVLEENKRKLKAALDEALVQVKENLCSSDFRGGRTISVVDGFIAKVNDGISEYVNTQYEEKSKLLALQVVELKRQSEMEKTKIEETLKQLNERDTQWKKVADDLLTQTNEIRLLQQALSTNNSVTEANR